MIGLPRVKICGITRIQDAELAIELGAHAIGLILWPRSPRALSVEHARALCRALPAFVTRVGVFVDQPLEHVASVADKIGLDAVQLHGDERAEDYAGLRQRVIKVVHLVDEDAVEDATRLPPEITLLVEGDAGERRGGAGQIANWGLAATLAAQRPIVLAGGLTPMNAADAVRQVQPWAVDVSSGVESAIGVKSPERLRAFFAGLAMARWGDE